MQILEISAPFEQKQSLPRLYSLATTELCLNICVDQLENKVVPGAMVGRNCVRLIRYRQTMRQLSHRAKKLQTNESFSPPTKKNENKKIANVSSIFRFYFRVHELKCKKLLDSHLTLRKVVLFTF